ncbi:MAG: PRTRC system protein C [Chloroflexota bacterium]
MTDQNTTPNRIFKIGATTIVADEQTAQMDNEQVRTLLKKTYPEVAHATIREVTLEDGTVALHFIAKAGRKG